MDLFPSFPAGRNRYGLLIFTSWGKKPNTEIIPIGGSLQLPCLPWNGTNHSKMGLDWRHLFGAANTTKKCTSDRNLLVTRATLTRVCSQVTQGRHVLHQEEQMFSWEGTQRLVVHFPGSQTHMKMDTLKIQTWFKTNAEQIFFYLKKPGINLSLNWKLWVSITAKKNPHKIGHFEMLYGFIPSFWLFARAVSAHWWLTARATCNTKHCNQNL